MRQLEIAALPSKKDREELDTLRASVAQLQAEIKEKDSKHKAAIESIRNTVTVLQNEKSTWQSKFTEISETHRRELEFKESQWQKEKVQLYKQIKDLKVAKTEAFDAESANPIVTPPNQILRARTAGMLVKPAICQSALSAQPDKNVVRSNSDHCVDKTSKNAKDSAQDEKPSALESNASNLISKSRDLIAFSSEDQIPPYSVIVSKKMLEERTEVLYADGLRYQVFQDETEKLFFPNGVTVIHFNNGDKKKV